MGGSGVFVLHRDDDVGEKRRQDRSRESVLRMRAGNGEEPSRPGFPIPATRLVGLKHAILVRECSKTMART